MEEAELDQAKARRKTELDRIDADVALWAHLQKQRVPAPYLRAAAALFHCEHRITGSAFDGFTCPGKFGESTLASAVADFVRDGEGAVFLEFEPTPGGARPKPKPVDGPYAQALRKER